MSRRLLTALSEFGACEVAVGWDAASGTFFGYVLDRSGVRADPWLVNVGGGPGEIREPREVVCAVRPYAIIPDGLVDELAAEAAASPAPARPRSWMLDSGARPAVMPAASPEVIADSAAVRGRASGSS